ncbi:hypothetical protein OXYTRIMIC_185 [Oxytricha trifallax]|uniref:Uncharacterized protein n=1 Tax=Oxytricha trifallax TaxID=1172189 RepID=A0A073IAJ3_9SPIT|nr:hypothetical protein OXYTRIMIC_185 [Oxytricha trifallax]
MEDYSQIYRDYSQIQSKELLEKFLKDITQFRREIQKFNILQDQILEKRFLAALHNNLLDIFNKIDECDFIKFCNPIYKEFKYDHELFQYYNEDKVLIINYQNDHKFLTDDGFNLMFTRMQYHPSTKLLNRIRKEGLNSFYKRAQQKIKIMENDDIKLLQLHMKCIICINLCIYDCLKTQCKEYSKPEQTFLRNLLLIDKKTLNECILIKKDFQFDDQKIADLIASSTSIVYDYMKQYKEKINKTYEEEKQEMDEIEQAILEMTLEESQQKNKTNKRKPRQSSTLQPIMESDEESDQSITQSILEEAMKDDPH